MSEKIVKITITPAGNASIEVDGVKGAGCKDISAPFERLYKERVSYTEKPEMFEGAACSVSLGTNG